MKGNEIFIRPYKEGDEEAIDALYQLVMSSPRPLEKWLWEFRESPGGWATIFVAEVEGQIISHYAHIPLPAQIGSRPLLSAKLEGAMVHPAHQRKGLFGKLIEASLPFSSERGIDVVWGFPNRPAHQATEVKKGIKAITSLKAMVKPLKFEGMGHEALDTRPLIKALLRPLGALLWLLKAPFFRQQLGHPSHEILIKGINSFDESFDELWQKAREGYGLTISRTSQFLNWRFVQNPHIQYYLLSAWREGELLGYMVLSVSQVRQKGLWCKAGFIADFFILSQEEEVLKNLLLTAIEYFKDQGAGLIFHFYHDEANVHRRFMPLFKRAGFRGIGGFLSKPFIVKALNPDVEDLVMEPKNWFITLAFTEGVLY